jgi:hypothetical protein
VIDGRGDIPEVTFAADALGLHDAGSLQHAEMLGHSLAGEIQAVGELSD